MRSLRRLAASKIAHESPGHTLQATALVHEAYLRLVNAEEVHAGTAGDISLPPRRRRCAAFSSIRPAASTVKSAAEAGAGWNLMRAPHIAAPEESPAADLLALDEALKLFEAEDPVRARVVKLRYFAGLSIPDTAQAVGISIATAKRHWVYARSWLYGKIQGRQSL